MNKTANTFPPLKLTPEQMAAALEKEKNKPPRTAGLKKPIAKELLSYPGMEQDVEEVKEELGALLTPDLIKTAQKNTVPIEFKRAHEGFMEILLKNPAATLSEIAEKTGYTKHWASMIINSDAFKAELSRRRKELGLDDIIISATEKTQALLNRAVEIIAERIEGDQIDLDSALQVFNAAARALGMGSKTTTVAVQNNFVVEVPAQVPDEREWEAMHQVKRGENS